MYFVLQIPSLQHLAQVNVVAHLWTQRDIFAQITQSCNGIPGNKLNYSAEWKTIKEKVQSKVSSLQIPERCKKQLLNFVEPLGIEFIAWCKYRNLESDTFQPLDNLLPDQLCWTMHGTIDHKKTAEVMVRDERVDFKNRYELACVNCLEDEARELFGRMDEEQRQEYLNGVSKMSRTHHGDLKSFFTCLLSGDVDQLHRHFKGLLSPSESISTYLFEYALLLGNRATCEYFFKKFNRRDKKQALVECQRNVSILTLLPSRNLVYYLSLMNEEEQELVLKTYITDVIVKLLEWPFQSLIVEVVKRWWSYMDESKCVEALHHITDAICSGFQDYDYSQLFWECWRLSPAEHKQRYLNDSEALHTLINTSKEEFIQLVLNEAPSHHVKKLVESRYEKISGVLMDESIMSDTALMECKEKAALNSSNEPENEEKRLRSQHLSRLIDIVMENRIKNRER